MGNARHIGRVGALAVALGVGFAVVTTPAVRVWRRPDGFGRPVSRADSAELGYVTALIMGGTTIPTPDDVYIDAVRNQFIAPTHPGQTSTTCAVTTPEEGWPLTGFVRFIGLALGPPSIFGPGGPAWPDEPWWKLSGLFDLTVDQSVQAGVADLERCDGRAPATTIW